ncbi:MAG: Tad domain-containing protein, partial [Planctomycetaceae bacterium]
MTEKLLQICRTSSKARLACRFARTWCRAHRNEDGTISIATVFCLLMFTMLLVMVVNVATHLDDKIKMQNAADASAYSGGVVLARGMNSLAFSNHLLCDVFAMTAYLREGRDRHGDEIAQELLDEWQTTGERLSQADFEKFQRTGQAVLDKLPKERELVVAFADMTAAASEYALPVFEMILEEQLIPEFQRAVLRTTPELARRTTEEIAWRNGLRQRDLHSLSSPRQRGSDDRERGPQQGVLWRMNVEPVGMSNEDDPLTRTLPAVDPSPAADDYSQLPQAETYFLTAVQQRRDLSAHYLEQWTRDKLSVFDSEAEMSQYSNLWRVFTVAQLEQLFDEYPDVNLPMVLRKMENGVDVDDMKTQAGAGTEINHHLELHYQYVSVVYRRHLPETGPGLFQNPLDAEADAVAFAQVWLFLPRSRWFLSSGGGGPPRRGLGGAPGFDPGIEPPPRPG